MTRSYSPKAVFRHVPAETLLPLFNRFHLTLRLDWHAHSSAADIDAAWQAVPEADRLRVEAALRDVHDLACEEGTLKWTPLSRPKKCVFKLYPPFSSPGMCFRLTGPSPR